MPAMPRIAVLIWILVSQCWFAKAQVVFECPSKSDEFVDIGIVDNAISQSRQQLSIRRNTQSGVVCILAKVVKAHPSAPELNSANKNSKSSDFHIVPLARAVNKKKWQNVAGKFGIRTRVTKCNGDRVCTVSISKDKTRAKKRYVLMTFKYSAKSFDEELSRFFMQSTFGPTRDMIKDWKFERNKNGMARWVHEQVTNVTATKHRVYWRERLDDDTKWFNGVNNMNAVPMHPCSAFSKWRNVTFDHFDYAMSFHVSKLPDGRTLISKNGLPRTVVDKLEVSKGGEAVDVQPGYYNVGK